MASNLYDSRHWRLKAEEARARAREMCDAISKQALLGLAENYEQLAQQTDTVHNCTRAHKA